MQLLNEIKVDFIATITGVTIYEAIKRGDYPSWTLEMQIMTPEQAKKYRFDILDITKVWPHGDFPPIKIGKLVLNRNPTNYFAEVEQAAFSPGNLVPGIGISPDKMLQARVFFLPRHPYSPSWSQLSSYPRECSKELA